MIIRLPDGSQKKVDISTMRVDELLRSLSLNPVLYLIRKDGRIIPEDSIVGGDDTIELIESTHSG
ncbi:thiamine S protein [Methanosarcinales archaeon]|uniref:Thiamine S protein n=1 Tax=Candidatus Syntropharchaeum caldarium TaxID=1838285 RepID=A0A1F2P907_9EURY|nr:MAG: thiamine S protein [Candidatus Syntrophoarchaeum caldarius]RLG34566.1 MAG: thiamine S protein [Methanosarcinales archaeon]